MGSGLGVAEGAALGLGVGLEEGELLGEGFGRGATYALGEADGEGVGVAEADIDGVGVGELPPGPAVTLNVIEALAALCVPVCAWLAEIVHTPGETVVRTPEELIVQTELGPALHVFEPVP